jgi:hypothetical protein
MLDMTQKVVGIHSIFNKDKNGHYTKKALLYQDIITYSIAKKKESFKDKDSFRHWDLAKYLMNKNAEYINRYKDPSSKHTPIKNRIENTQRRTKENVQHMIDLGLMKKSDYVKESKGTGSIPTFTYTLAGCCLHGLFKVLIHTNGATQRRKYIKYFMIQCLISQMNLHLFLYSFHRFLKNV